MSRDHIDMQLRHEWHQLLGQISAPATPPRRLRPATLWVQLEDLLLQWREIWTSEWFAADQGQLITSEWTLKDVIAHVTSWAGELRAQAEILADGNGVGYRILFDEIGGPRSWNAEKVEMRRSRSLEELIGEIESETVRLQDLLLGIDVPAISTEHPIGIAWAATPTEPWIRSIAGLVEMRCFHERYHMNRIIAWDRAKSAGDF